MGAKITPEDLLRCREAFDAAIEASRQRSAADEADHHITMARMRVAKPDDALAIARAYAERRGFTRIIEAIDSSDA
jgi:hypothetical protein